jgi:hypothetical protein
MKLLERFNRRSSKKEKGVASLEAALFTPALLLLWAGIGLGTSVVSADRALHWAVGEAVLQHNLGSSAKLTAPALLSAAAEPSFSVDYNVQAKTFSNYSMQESWRDCKLGDKDITCAAWKVMLRVAQSAHSSLASNSSLKSLKIFVKFSSLPVPANTNPELGKYRVLTVSVNGPVQASWAAGLGPLSSFPAAAGVSRTEAS